MQVKTITAYGLLVSASLSGAFAGASGEERPKNEAPTTARKSGGSDLMVVDVEYANPEKGFKMQAPADWKVNTDYSGYAFFMEPTAKIEPTDDNPVVADPNISVSVTRNPVFIDAQSLNEFGKELEARFTEVNGASGLQVFNKNIVDLPAGKKGLLYYFTYKKNGFDVMSAILVMSNSKAMYKVTLTDYKVSFDKNLERYFPVMASVIIDGAPLQRQSWVQAFAPWGAGMAGVLVLTGTLVFFGRRRNEARLNSYLSDSGDSPSGAAEPSQHSFSEIPQKKKKGNHDIPPASEYQGGQSDDYQGSVVNTKAPTSDFAAGGFGNAMPSEFDPPKKPRSKSDDNSSRGSKAVVKEESKPEARHHAQTVVAKKQYQAPAANSEFGDFGGTAMASVAANSEIAGFSEFDGGAPQSTYGNAPQSAPMSEEDFEDVPKKKPSRSSR